MIDSEYRFFKTAFALVPLALLLGGCASSLDDTYAQDRLEQARTAFAAAKSDPQVEASAPQAMTDATLALQEAERSRNADEVAHFATIAETKVQTARVAAEGKMAEMELQRMGQMNAQILLQKRERETRMAREEAASKGRELEKAKQQIEMSSSEAAEARRQAQARSTETEQARRESEQARSASEQARIASERSATESAQARAQTGELMKELSDMKAKETERGLVLTLGDVLFETGKSEISPRAKNSIDRLAEFLGNHPDRNLMVEGFTDSVGSASFNRELSEKRADSVRKALVARGIEEDRVDIKGYGKANPVADNDTAHGRQLNRRVEVIILNQGAAGGQVSPR